MFVMYRRLVLIVMGVMLALIAAAGGTAAALPAVRHIVSALWNLPDRLPSLAENNHVHFEPGAEDYARDVSALLPAAIARVEAAHGRPFAHPVTVGVYATPEAYAAANGLGPIPVGTTFYGRVNLSPKLFWPQHRRLAAILTHELSHAHLQGWIGESAFLRLPSWFKEGLAVMVSGGGGAELVSEDQARAAIQRGEQIAIDDAGDLKSLGEIRFDRAPEQIAPSWYPTVLAYRQAGMFVSYLREKDGEDFERMMNAIFDGRSFADAIAAGYQKDLHTLWREFATTNAEPK
jgi:hypothetical protein